MEKCTHSFYPLWLLIGLAQQAFADEFVSRDTPAMQQNKITRAEKVTQKCVRQTCPHQQTKTQSFK